MTTAMFGLALAAALAAAPDDGDGPEISGDLRKLQGAWVTDSAGEGEVTYTFEGRTLKVVAPGRSYVMTVTLDESAEPEKTIDFRIDEAPDDARGRTSPGIYKFEGDDKFVFCFRPEGDRPDRYEQVGFEQFLTTLTRRRQEPEPGADPGPGPERADSDAPLPDGWPGATRPGRIEVKEYPAYRSAIIRTEEGRLGGPTAGLMFWPLFNHIQRSDIAMTSPVVMTYDATLVTRQDARGPMSMEFLYRRADQGEVGPGVGAVVVEDRPAGRFVCLGQQGAMTEEKLREGVARLRSWLQEHAAEWVADGPPRQLGYHGPMTPVDRRLIEVQIPVRPADGPKD